MLHKIANVKTLPSHLLWVEFRDGSERLYDVVNLIEIIEIRKNVAP